MMAQTDTDKTRDFICPCGKGYFSYAALFTHIKQKHNGKVTSPLFSRPDKSSSPNPNTREDVPARRSPLAKRQLTTGRTEKRVAARRGTAPHFLI
jgi:hypothetical protein